MSMTQDTTQNGFPKLNTPFVQEDRNIEIPWYRLLITLWNRTGAAGGNGSIAPSGGMMDWGGTIGTIPDGWLLCNGLLVSRAAYASLFAAIGTTWGAGDGLTTFGLPNLVGRVRRGTNGASPAPGTYGGSDTVSLSSDQLAPHNHTITDPGHFHTVTDPGHTHGQNVVNSGTAGVLGTQGASTANTTTIGTTATATTGITATDSDLTGITATDSEGSGNPINVVPANASVLVIIKT